VALKIEAEKILFSHMLLEEKPSFMLDYLESKPELKNVYLNTGAGYLEWMLAEIYLYGGRADSALFYFKKAEPSFTSGYDLVVRKNFFGELATCYDSLAMIPQAISYYHISYDLSREAADLRTLKSATGKLKDLYRVQGDYKQAYAYSLLFDNYKDSVELLGREKDLALLEIDNVARQQQRDMEFAKESQRRKYNLQYMLITIVVATVFLLMIMIGMFKVATTTIRLMGFLSLIFFFEFIILLLDNWIHHLTHGEPWKVWLIKIGIISILLPVHHYLEHKLIKYLLSRHLIIVRNRLSLTRLFGRRKKNLPKAEAPEESAGSARIV
jgi:tetratricopeptide (TPR) repeat protein